MFRPFSILVVLTLGFGSQAFAWSWKDAVQQTVDRNPSLLALQEGEGVFELRYEAAKTVRYPSFRLVGIYQEYQDSTENFRYRTYLGPEVQWLLYQGGKVQAGIEQAYQLSREADLSTRMLSVTKNSELREAFAQALYAKNFLDLAHRIQTRREENLKFTKIRYESGLDYKWVYLSSESKWRQAALNTEQAEMNKKTVLSDLEKLTGPLTIESVEELNADGFYDTEAEYDLNQMTERIVENPNYLYKQAKIDESEATVAFNRGNLYPQIALQGDFWIMSTEENSLFPAWFAGVRLSMPIFEFNRNRKNVDSAKHLVAQRKYDWEQTKLDLKSELEKTYQAYLIAKKQVEVSKLNVEATKDRARVVSNQYRSGLTTFLDWENSQDGWVNAEIELLDNIRDYQVARARLDAARGVELSKQ